jgi:outer membrane murein-binding lipoprotein Lpp
MSAALRAWTGKGRRTATGCDPRSARKQWWWVLFAMLSFGCASSTQAETINTLSTTLSRLQAERDALRAQVEQDMRAFDRMHAALSSCSDTTAGPVLK